MFRIIILGWETQPRQRPCGEESGKKIGKTSELSMTATGDQNDAQDHGEKSKYEISPDEVKRRFENMKEYLKEIANSQLSEYAPLPQLERHQAWILVGGCNKHYKEFETYSLATDTFS